MEQQQNTIWYDEASRLVFAELVNVFYARELPKLAELSDHTRLQRLLNSLPYYVERAATHIIHGDVPLELDSFNGCWLAKQKSQPKCDDAANAAFFTTKVKVGLVVPVLYADSTGTNVRLDSVDQVGEADKLHCNQFGWFSVNGNSLQASDEACVQLLKPTKALMTAACCGHTWHFGKAAIPRRLTLREMLLASAINWPQVQKTKMSQ